MKIIRLAFLLIIPCFISCYEKTSKTAKSNDTDYDVSYNDSMAAVEALVGDREADGKNINAFLDEYISKHPNCFNNDIQREKTGKELHPLLKEKLKNNPSFLFDIPVKFAKIQKVKASDNKGYKYLTTFTCSSLRRTGKYNISFTIITALSEEVAATLIDDKEYYIKGSFLDFTEKKSFTISKFFDDETIEIGGIFLKDPFIIPA